LENVSLDRYVGLREKCLEDLGILQDPLSERFEVKPDCRGDVREGLLVAVALTDDDSFEADGYAT